MIHNEEILLRCFPARKENSQKVNKIFKEAERNNTHYEGSTDVLIAQPAISIGAIRNRRRPDDTYVLILLVDHRKRCKQKIFFKTEAK